MQLSTHFNEQAGCPLSLHKRQINPVRNTVEAVDFDHEIPEPLTASLFT